MTYEQINVGDKFLLDKFGEIVVIDKIDVKGMQSILVEAVKYAKALSLNEFNEALISKVNNADSTLLELVKDQRIDALQEKIDKLQSKVDKLIAEIECNRFNSAITTCKYTC